MALPQALNDFLRSPAIRDFQAWVTKPPFGPLNTIHESRLRGREWNDWASLAYTISTLPLLAQAYLIVKPGTRPQRAALGVLGLGMFIPCWMEYRFHGECAAAKELHRRPPASNSPLTPDPAFNMANASLALYAFFVVARYLEWSCIVGPIVDPRLLRTPSPSGKTRFLSALDLTINYRNIGLGSIGLDNSLGPQNGTLKEYYYMHPRWESRGRAATVAGFLFAASWRYALADIIVAFTRTLGDGTLCQPGGRLNSIDAFIDQWDYPQRGVAFIFANGVIGTMVALYLSAAHYAIAALAVATLWEPNAWDFPLFNSPLLSTSINEMWSRRWHQVIRVSPKPIHAR